MNDTDLPRALRYPTPELPLLGRTVLIVEDSRLTCEAVRMLCQRSGARIRRADSLAAADRHLRVYRPTILLVDLGLPDGSGLDLIRRITRSPRLIDVVVAISGDDSQEQAATQAGADGFMAKPLTSLASFQEMILQQLPGDQRPLEPRAVNDTRIRPDPMIYAEDLRHAAKLLEPGMDADTLDYVVQFLLSLSHSAQDHALHTACLRLDAVASTCAPRPPRPIAMQTVQALLHKRLAAVAEA
jgi:DNA-binding response OmpR family regulator